MHSDFAMLWLKSYSKGLTGPAETDPIGTAMQDDLGRLRVG
jgi:hypothetical protein